MRWQQTRAPARGHLVGSSDDVSKQQTLVSFESTACCSRQIPTSMRPRPWKCCDRAAILSLLDRSLFRSVPKPTWNSWTRSITSSMMQDKASLLSRLKHGVVEISLCVRRSRPEIGSRSFSGTQGALNQLGYDQVQHMSACAILRHDRA